MCLFFRYFSIASQSTSVIVELEMLPLNAHLRDDEDVDSFKADCLKEPNPSTVQFVMPPMGIDVRIQEQA